MHINKNYAYESNIAMFCAVLLFLCTLLCCWNCCRCCRICSIESNNQEAQNQETIEMDNIRGEDPRDNPLPEIWIERPNGEIDQDNTLY